MSVVGYRRVSTEEQSFDRQDLGPVDRLFEEKLSAKNAKDRPALNFMIDWVREGDVVVVHAIDRLARDLRDLQSIIKTLNDKGVEVTFRSENLTFSANSDDAFAKLQLQMMGAFAEFERNIIRKRQAEGIAKARAKGIYLGRPKTVDRAQVKELKEAGMGATAIAKRLGIGRATVYKVLSD
ncbi:recombinase family protein [Octadecabacter sp. G9-8]|uniref:Recombinase family protein n=1 Tax=Octadecabacter dasysiphoniae TaxID=2909341 RepID=A0ABS9CUS1_9RHOB|nr:recombinase family protein [Octadecabacter dasysiphoniae]MCF2870502.1 recombinase family protein [Octadecabacter dasysiphoniae]